jgi:hypothetical protein
MEAVRLQERELLLWHDAFYALQAQALQLHAPLPHTHKTRLQFYTCGKQVE